MKDILLDTVLFLMAFKEVLLIGIVLLVIILGSIFHWVYTEYLRIKE